MTDPEFDRRILRFEQERRRGGSRAIADFLGDHTDPAGRERLLIELICIDLEFRWQNPTGGPQAIMLEDYVEQFPELNSLDALPLELIAEEYRVRHRWGDRPSHREFLSRFSRRREEIGAELLRVDEELEAEGPQAPRPGPGGPPAPVQAETPADVPLLSHDEFLLRRLIGAGRMGKVYEARTRDATRVVAVKFLRKTLLRDPRVVGRFIGEATTISRLRHPHIVGTRGLGRTPGGSYFIVMDFMAGPNLAVLGARGEVAVDEALRWAMETCEALEHAHAMGVVHCDLKPANLLLDECGKVRVTDFGLARSLTEDTPWAAEVEGTAPFMAPEQVSRDWGPIDHRTDVYGLGAVLFTLLTGRPPILGRRISDILARVVAGAPVVSAGALRPALPGPLCELCQRCLSKAPDQRYQTIGELRSALASVLS